MIPDFNAVNAGNSFCVLSGSFVVYFEEKPDNIDAFCIYLPTESKPGFRSTERMRDMSSYEIGMPMYLNFLEVTHMSSRDSITYDYFNPRDRSFDPIVLSGVPNLFREDRPYRLRFETSIQEGINKGKVLHATVHYLFGWSDIPAREPVSFEMYVVE